MWIIVKVQPAMFGWKYNLVDTISSNPKITTWTFKQLYKSLVVVCCPHIFIYLFTFRVTMDEQI